jgi:hypothetical protein
LLYALQDALTHNKDAIAKLKNYKSPGSNKIQVEMIQAGGEILLSAIHKLINSLE